MAPFIYSALIAVALTNDCTSAALAVTAIAGVHAIIWACQKPLARWFAAVESRWPLDW